MTDKFVSQFGETLYKSSDGTNVSASSALAGKDYIMLYFSAKWCGPCRKFTPSLIEFYEKIKLTKNVEVVFCSLDQEEDQYKEYTSKMPWFSMPFAAEETQTLAKKYGAQGIPHLVVVNGATGELITDDGTAELRSDPEGAKFPWKPKTFAEVWPSQILSSKGSDEKFLNSDLKDKYLMLYFSAHWCPPCRAFTPKLSKFYEKLKAQRSDFELVFVSSDSDEEKFKEYFDTMSFCALPFEYRDEKAALSKMFKVRGIPMLIILGPAEETGNRPVINTRVRDFVEKEDFAEFPYHKKNYGDVRDALDDINDVKSVVLFHENGDDDEQDEIKSMAKEAATKAKEAGKEVNVYWSLSPGKLGEHIRSLTGLPKVSENPAMIMLDVPKYHKSAETEVTVDKIMAFIETPGETFSLEG